MPAPRYLSADEAADALGISKNTLYAYVSRGWVRSEPSRVGERRTRRYRAEDIERLVGRKRLRRDPGAAARDALYWGLPIMDSELTLIDDGRLYYRGHDALVLAETQPLEAVAGLLWRGDLDEPVRLNRSLRIRLNRAQPPVRTDAIKRMPVMLALSDHFDEWATTQVSPQMVHTGERVLYALLRAIVDDPDEDMPGGPGVADVLHAHWTPDKDRAHTLLSAALVCCADHELNVTTLAARCAASAGATLYGVVQAGLAALEGHRHAGNTARIRALLYEAGEPDDLGRVIGQRLNRGDAVPGFGHRLYPEGDPRAAFLIDLLHTHYPDAEGTAFALAAQDAGPKMLSAAPAVDFALVALARALGLPRDAPLLLFALSRAVGWIAHAIEQYITDDPIRPRARYIGPVPDAL